MLVGYAAASVEVSVERGEFFGHPAHARADDEAAAGDDVQRRQHLGVERRVSIGQHQDAEAQMDGIGYRCQIGQSGDGFQDQVFGIEGKASVGTVGDRPTGD